MTSLEPDGLTTNNVGCRVGIQHEVAPAVRRNTPGPGHQDGALMTSTTVVPDSPPRRAPRAVTVANAPTPSDPALIGRFVDDHQPLGRSSGNNYRRALWLFSDRLGGRGLLKATTGDVAGWVASIPPKRRNEWLSILHRFYRWAQNHGLIGWQPTARLWMTRRRTVTESVKANRLARLDDERSLDSLAAAYIDGRAARGEIAHLTVDTLRLHLSSFCDVVGVVAPGDLSRGDVERWLESMQGLAPSTRRGRFSNVKCFLRWLVATDILARDPSAGIASLKVPRPVHRALGTDSASALLSSCADSRERLVVTLGLQLGLRRAEIAGLELGDIDIPRGILIVRHGKGGHQRVLPIPEAARRALACYLADYRFAAGPLIRGERRPESGVAPIEIGRMVSRLAYDAEIKVAGRDGVSCHALRHTAATDIYTRTRDVLGRPGRARPPVTQHNPDLRSGIGHRGAARGDGRPQLPGHGAGRYPDEGRRQWLICASRRASASSSPPAATWPQVP
jgi:integrase